MELLGGSVQGAVFLGAARRLQVEPVQVVGFQGPFKECEWMRHGHG